MPCTCGNCNSPGTASTSGGGINVSPYTFTNFNTLTTPVATTGAAVNIAFPRVNRVALVDFKTNAGLIALTLSSSLTVPVAGVAGFFVALDQGPVANVNGLSRLFLSHLTNQNSLPGIPNPSSRSNALQMGQQSYFMVPSNQKIAVYACAPNDAAVLMSCVLTALWLPSAA